MTGDYVILRLFLIKILYSHTNMVSGLSGQKDTWWGTECSVGLAMTAAAHGHGLSNRLLLFSPPLFACCPGWAQTPNPPARASACKYIPLYLDSLFAVTGKLEEGK